MAAKNIQRRQAIPILYTRGTHYDVGFDMGRTFGSMIKNFLLLCDPLNDVYLPLYNTEEGKNIYNETLESVKRSYPQYVRELEGIAEGAQVEFHKLFLLHMDEIMPKSMEHLNTTTTKNQPVGCSTIILNGKENRILAHTEDALTETLNHYYFVVAHVIDGTKEERFMSLCYAGHLPGYTMSYNHHGLVFSINTLAAEFLRSGKTPRHFITRALLATEHYEQALNVLKDSGVGAADGCSINMTFLNDPTKMCYNIEMAPVEGSAQESRLDVQKIPEGVHNCHVNMYERLQVEEANEVMQDSSISRRKTFGQFKPPTSRHDILQMLGDCSGGEHCVFRENCSLDQAVKTIAVGVFDLNAKTLSLYSDNPKEHEALVTLPLVLKQ